MVTFTEEILNGKFHFLVIFSYQEWCFASSAHRKSFRTWFYQILVECGNFVYCLMQHSKNYRKWPETYSFCMVIATHSFKILPSFLHGYLTPQLQTIGTNPPHRIFLNWWSHVIFFGRTEEIVSILVTIISNITLLVSQNVIFFRYFILMGHAVNKKIPPSASFPPSSPYQVFTRFVCRFTINTLPNLFGSLALIIERDRSFSK